MNQKPTPVIFHISNHVTGLICKIKSQKPETYLYWIEDEDKVLRYWITFGNSLAIPYADY